jgi:hypothetical protein
MDQCPRPDTHLTYMINIALTTEFAIDAGPAGLLEYTTPVVLATEFALDGSTC